MQIESVVKNAQSGDLLNNLAQAFGVSPEQAEIATHAMFDALSQKVERRSLSNGGLADVVSLLGNVEAGRAIHDGQNLSSAHIEKVGNSVLDVLVGSKHESRGIAGRAASAAGIEPDIAKRMLPVIASMLTGGLQKETQALFADRLRDVPGLGGLVQSSLRGSPLPLPGEPPVDDGASGGWGIDLPKPAGGAGGGIGGTIGGGSPLPVPGDTIPGVGRRNRYDDLSDVIRKGGAQKAPVPSSGTLGGLIRSILGGLLGFGNRGILGSLFQLFLIRVLPAILRRIFAR